MLEHLEYNSQRNYSKDGWTREVVFQRFSRLPYFRTNPSLALSMTMSFVHKHSESITLSPNNAIQLYNTIDIK